MSTPTATQQPAPHSALRRLVARHPVAAFLVMTEVMNLSFAWLPWPALTATLGATALTIALGLIGTFSALSQKPEPVLRHLSEKASETVNSRQSAARRRSMGLRRLGTLSAFGFCPY